jgi:predicted dehydrogenase
MSYNVINMNTNYSWLSKINLIKWNKKSILIIGSGGIAEQYCIALSQMKIKDVTILSRSFDNASSLAKNFNFNPMGGGYEENLKMLKKFDLVIIALPINSLILATKTALESGQTNILVEKPGSLYFDDLLELNSKILNQKIRIAYNRLVYPNFHLLKELVSKEGGILSCNFSFTEWIHTINFKNNDSDIYERWGISNSLHVISMVAELIGFPKKLHPIQYGKFSWHPSGSIFVGSGMSEQNIPFSYHSNWESGGRWGIEIMTKENVYRLTPLENLYVCPKGSVEWKKINFELAFSSVKFGISEEIALMLDHDMEKMIPLVSLKKAAKLNKFAEQIFNY